MGETHVPLESVWSELLKKDTWYVETSTSYFFDRAELFCFLPLVKILNFGLPNELQNTRGRQSKNSLSHFIFPEDNRHNCILLRGCFLPLKAAFQFNNSSFMRSWMQRSFKGTRVCYNFSGGLQWNLLASQLNKLCLWQLFTFSWFHLVPKIISLISYSSRRTSNSVEIFVWIRFHHFVWDFKLNFKFH